MENWTLFPVIVVGFVLIAVLVLAANLTVKKLIGIAAYFNLSSTFMGMTVVSLATSIPEITSHVTASTNILRGTLDFQIGSAIVVGSNIGSDVVQQTLILGGAPDWCDDLQTLFYVEEYGTHDRIIHHMFPPGFGWNIFKVGWHHPLWAFYYIQPISIF